MLPWAAVAAVALVIGYRYLVNTYGPNDRTGNGITVGEAKAFDNRSLTLMLEQLNASLQAFNVVSQNVVENLGTLQGESSTETEKSVRAGWKWPRGSEPAPGSARPAQDAGKTAHLAGGARETGETTSESGASTAQPASSRLSSEKPNRAAGMGISAGDALTEQLNLAYQIFNLRILNERALSDRLHYSESNPELQPRLQVVLGFQVSINPPAGMQDCAAVVEIGLKMKDSDEPISIVALIPQEKTYNSAALSTKAESVDGSVVASVVKVGVSGSHSSKDLYLHRDADTIAFERIPKWRAGAFWARKEKASSTPQTVFGWEFRPVLGRRTVSPGTRQMLAVVALPFADEGDRAKLTVETRTYWRAYNRRRQTTAPRWGWWPLSYPRARQVETAPRDLQILSTVEVQTALKPVVENVHWVDAGDGTAVVVVEGRNFFSGTEVIIGGISHRGPETGLVLKSDRAFEVRTAVAALGMGDVLLSGRFGPAVPLALPPERLPAPAIHIDRRKLFLAAGGFRGLELVVCGMGNQPLLHRHLQGLPNPVIYVNGRPVPTPYDYDDYSRPGTNQGQPYAVIVRASVPADFVQGGNPVVLFKVPFCGPDWVARAVITADAPKVERLGGEQQETITIISPGFDFEDKDNWIVSLDEDYALGSKEFKKLDRRRLQFTLPAKVMQSYPRLVLRSLGADSSYVLDIPTEAGRNNALAALDDSKGSPSVRKGKSAVVDWQGTALHEVTKVLAGAEQLPFESYAQGQCLRVFLSTAQTAKAGKLDLTFVTETAATLPAAVFVVEEALSEARPETPSPLVSKASAS